MINKYLKYLFNRDGFIYIVKGDSTDFYMQKGFKFRRFKGF